MLSQELEPLSDTETEHAVQALQRQSSSFSAHISSPTRGPFAPGPGKQSPGVPFPIPNPATPPADIHPFITDTDCQIPDSHLRPSSPAMPVLDVEPQALDSASQQPDAQHLSPCPDPYCLPPVLSPQIPDPSHIMEPDCLYSDPPVLSPQQYIADELKRGPTLEMDIAESVCQSVPAATVPISTLLLPSEPLRNAEGLKGSNQDSLLEFSGIICSANGLECATLFSRRSRSLPRQSATAPNPKKRCRSASPKHSHSKRMRIRAKFDYSGSWTEQGHKSSKPESDIIATPEGCLLSDKVSSQIIQSCHNPKISSAYTQESLGVREIFTMLYVPAIQYFTQVPNQIDILGHGSTSVADQPSRPPPSKMKTFDPHFHSLHDKSHSAFSSQESQRSLSHSTSVCIESALIPDLATLSPSSDSDWDCDLLSRLGPTPAPLSPTEQSCELDKDLLHRPCTWMHDTSYESRLHTVLQPSTPAASLCVEEMDPSVFSRTVVQIVEVQH